MANEKRLIDADLLLQWVEKLEAYNMGRTSCFRKPKGLTPEGVRHMIDTMPEVVAVDVKQYKALLEMYHELRENFIDYVCSGVPNLAPYCLNKCKECVDCRGWCKTDSDKCHGFNPAEVII